jgi:hypothetical protein
MAKKLWNLSPADVSFRAAVCRADELAQDEVGRGDMGSLLFLVFLL